MADKAKRDEEKTKNARKALREYDAAKKDSLHVTHQQMWAYSAMCKRGCQQPTNVELFRPVPVQATRFAVLTAGYLEAVTILISHLYTSTIISTILARSICEKGLLAHRCQFFV